MRAQLVQPEAEAPAAAAAAASGACTAGRPGGPIAPATILSRSLELVESPPLVRALTR